MGGSGDRTCQGRSWRCQTRQGWNRAWPAASPGAPPAGVPLPDAFLAPLCTPASATFAHRMFVVNHCQMDTSIIQTCALRAHPVLGRYQDEEPSQDPQVLNLPCYADIEPPCALAVSAQQPTRQHCEEWRFASCARRTAAVWPCYARTEHLLCVEHHAAHPHIFGVLALLFRPPRERVRGIGAQVPDHLYRAY